MSLKDIRPALVAFLLADSGIAAVVGTRVCPMRLPQGVKGDSIVYTRVSGEGDHHMQGPSGLARVRMQIDAWSKTIPAAAALANLVKELIDGYQGTMGLVEVQGIFFDGEREDYDDTAEMYRVSRDYIIVYAER